VLVLDGFKFGEGFVAGGGAAGRPPTELPVEFPPVPLATPAASADAAVDIASAIPNPNTIRCLFILTRRSRTLAGTTRPALLRSSADPVLNVYKTKMAAAAAKKSPHPKIVSTKPRRSSDFACRAPWTLRLAHFLRPHRWLSASHCETRRPFFHGAYASFVRR
jgi:hypothetical protein